MQINLYNSLTRQIEQFSPLKDNLVRMYSCGPTVYNYAHIGNMRAFLFADLLQRVLRVVGGYQVQWVMNITNIDDKTIRDSKLGSSEWKTAMGLQSDDAKLNLKLFTDYYERAFVEDIEELRIKKNSFYAMPKATDYIQEMQELIVSLIRKDIAYISDGSIYFNVAKWRNLDLYGKLKKIDFENFRVGERIDSDQYDKEQVNDFVLWKAYKDAEPFWDFVVDGKNYPGRPGWHIECSAMEKELLGLPFDIHTGGVDLKFPHHEDEIAQSKAGYGIEPTVFWCHNEFLEVEGKKMSKSLGNFYTLRDLKQKGIDPKDIRFLMLSAHYASTFNFTFDGIAASKKAKQKVNDFIQALLDSTTGSISINVKELENKVFAHLTNDLHTPKALAELFSFINSTIPSELTKETKNEILEFLNLLNQIFDVWSFELEKKAEIPDNIYKLAEARFKAKQEKRFADADVLRDEIIRAGYTIKDSKDGFTLEANK